MPDPKDAKPPDPPVKKGYLATPDWFKATGINAGKLGNEVIGNTGKSQYDNYKSFVDPNFIDVAHPDQEISDKLKLSQLQYNRAAQQPWSDKLGNGLVKFAGSFADGVLSTVGTIYGIPASIINMDETKLWDNPFTNLGSDISKSIGENFMNYRDKAETEASAWSPDYWMTLNFATDNILGNLGYAAAAWATGAGMSKMLTKMAPYIAGNNLATGMEALIKGGDDLMREGMKGYNAVKRWDAIQQAISVGISTGGEASVEALGASKEYKEMMIAQMADQYGGKDNIPKSVLDTIDRDSKSVGNVTYGINLPILAGANMLQWGKSLSGFNSEFKQMSKNAAKVSKLGEYGTYQASEDVIKKGVARNLSRALTATGKALKSNITEAGQEGFQFIGAEGTKNWYQRHHEQAGWDAVSDYLDPYMDAVVKLVSTQEGVANLLGGFTGGSAFGLKDYYRALAGDPKAKELLDKQLEQINNPFAKLGGGTIKENLKIYMQNMARHASAEYDLQDALATGNELGARNAKFDQLKSYIDSRIQTGRMDLLQDEMNQLSQLSELEFKQFFNLEATDNVSKKDILGKFQNTAKEMHDTYKMMDRLFTPDMYRMNNLPPEVREQKLNELGQYKRILWSYMMDYKNRDKRANKLDAEISEAFAGMIPLSEIMSDKFTGKNKDELNDLYRQYTAADVEHQLNSAADKPFAAGMGFYKGSNKEAEVLALKKRIKDKIMEITENSPEKFTTMEEFQGMNKKDYIEDYLFNIDKRIMPALNNPVVQAAYGAKDINETIGKIHDLTDLHSERRMAIHSYNQLAGAIKTGKFLERFMDNPDYDEGKHKDQAEFIKDPKTGDEVFNPDYVPKRILSDAMLQYDGYAKATNERKDFYKELNDKHDKNKQEQDDFEKMINDMTDDNLTEASKQYHKRVKSFANSNKKGRKAMKSLDNNQLAILGAAARRQIDTAEMTGEFETATAKDRKNFDIKKYIDMYARLKAVNDERRKREKAIAEAIDKAAKALVLYVTDQNIDPALLVPGFKINNQIVRPEVVKRAAIIIAERAAQKAEAEALERQKKAAEEAGLKNKKPGETVEGELITDELWADFQANGKLTEGRIGDIFDELADKLANGDLLTEREEAVYNGPQKQMFDDKVKLKYGINPIVNVDRTTTGAVVEQEPIIPTEIETKEIIKKAVIETQAETDRMIGTYDGAFIRLRRADLEVEREGNKVKDNVYNEEGDVITRQLHFPMFDPYSPVNLHTKPQIRFKYAGDTSGKKAEPRLMMQVRATNDDVWEDTPFQMQGVYDYTTGEVEDIDLTKHSKRPGTKEELLASYRALIVAMQEEAVRTGFTYVDIKGDVGYGHVIENKKDEDGFHQERGILSLGAINDESNPSSVWLGVIFDDNITDALGVFADENGPRGPLTDVNELPGVFVPKSLMNKISSARGRNIANKTGNRGGQYFALLPTGKATSDGSRQVYFPVLLAGKKLSAYTTMQYDIGSGNNKGTAANIGEILVDALLNPYDPKYHSIFPTLFEMAGLKASDYDGPDNTEWKLFYQDDLINTLINKVMFASNKSLNNRTNYVAPFKFEVMDTSGRGGAIKVKIGIVDPLMLESVQEKMTMEIFISTKEGKLIKPQTDEERNDFVQARINKEIQYQITEKKKALNPKDFERMYEYIQNVIKDKAFHVQISEMSVTAKNRKAFTGLVLENGKLVGKTFDSYFHYLDELKLAQTTVQGATDPKTGRKQFMVNQRVYFSPRTKKTEEKQPEPVPVLKPTDIHKAADAAGIPWNDDKAFMELSKKLTGVSKLDDMDQTQLKTMLDHINKQKPVKKTAPVEVRVATYEEMIKGLIDNLNITNVVDRLKDVRDFLDAFDFMLDKDMLDDQQRAEILKGNRESLNGLIDSIRKKRHEIIEAAKKVEPIPPGATFERVKALFHALVAGKPITEFSLEEQVIISDPRFNSERDRHRELETLTKGIPTMFTKKMEADLKAAGFTDAQVNKMTPIIAQNAIVNAKYDAILEKVLPKVDRKQTAAQRKKAAVVQLLGAKGKQYTIADINSLIDTDEIEEDCSGATAAEGAQFGFTRGGTWEVVKDLKGYPTHAHGGVDISIGSDGVRIYKKDAVIEAKHGLVIPNIKK